MYLHLGADISIFAGDVIGIFDYELINSGPFREFLELAQWNDKVSRLEGETKAIVLTPERVYFVPVSRATLARRWDKHTKPFYPGVR